MDAPSPSFVTDPSPSPRPGSKLDSLSREDLLKFLKKQQLNLQKSKEKNEGLLKRIQELEATANPVPPEVVEDEQASAAQQQVEHQVEVLHEECDQLRQALADTRLENDEKVKQLRDEIDLLSQARDSAVESLKNFRVEAKESQYQLHERLRIAEDKFQSTMEEASRSLESVVKVAAERDKALSERCALEQKCQSLEAQVTEVESESSNAESLIAGVRKQLVEAEAEIVSLSEDNDQLQRNAETKMAELKAELLTKDDELKRVLNEVKRKDDLLMGAQDELESKICENEAEWRTRLDDMTALKNELYSRDETLKQLETTIQERDMQLDELREEVRKKDEKTEDSASIQELKEKISANEEEVKRLKLEIQEKDTNLMEAKNDVLHLESKLKRELETIQGELAEKVAAIDQMETERAVKNVELNDMKAQIDKLVLAGEDDASRCETMENELQKLLAQLDAKQEEFSLQGDRHDKVINEFNQLKEQSEDEVAQLTLRIKSFEEDKERSDEVIARLEEKLRIVEHGVVVADSNTDISPPASVHETNDATVAKEEDISYAVLCSKKEQLEATIVTKDDKIAQLTEESEACAFEISRLKQELVELLRRRSGTEDDGLEKNRDEAASSVSEQGGVTGGDGHSGDSDWTCNRCSSLANQVTDLNRDLHESHDQLDSVSAKLELASGEGEQMKEENNSLKRYIVKLETECASRDEQMIELNSATASNERDLNDKVSEMESELALVRSSESTLQTDVTALRQRSDDADQDLADCCHQRDELQVQLTSAKAELSELRQDMVSISELRERLAGTEKDLLDKHCECDDLTAKIATLTQSLNEVNIANSELHKTKETLHCELNRISEELERSQQTVGLLEAQQDSTGNQQRQTILKITEASALLEKQVSQLQAAYEKAQTDLETEVENSTVLKHNLAETTDMLSEAQSSLEAAERKNELLTDDVTALKTQLEDLDKVRTELSEASTRITQLEDAKSTLEGQVERLTTQLQETEKDTDQHSVLNLEMADYERSIRNLQQELDDRQGKIDHLNGIITSKDKETGSANKEIETLKAKNSKLEENITKLKTLVVKTRKEMAESKKQIESKESDIHALESKIQEANRDSEQLKLQLSTAISEGQTASQRLTESLSSKNSVLHNAESRCSNYKSQLSSVQQQLNALQNEYHAYKAKVQNVLKQHKQSTQEDAWAVERDHLTKTAQLLQEKLQESSACLIALKSDHSSLQDDHERNIQKYRELQFQTDAKERALNSELEKLRTESDIQSVRHAETIKQLTSQNELTRNEFQTRIQEIQSDQKAVIGGLQERLTVMESELNMAKRHLAEDIPNGSGSTVDASTTAHASIPLSLHIRPQDDAHLSFLPGVPPLSERHPGVGSESVSTPKISTPTSPSYSSTVLPLEDLLSREQDIGSGLISPSLEAWDAAKASVEKAKRRNDHLNEILNESEANNARLTEQVKLLKEEIRRLQRNEERQEHVANAEYLKNIVLKFLTLNPGDERSRLIPVIQTMLRLSNDEIKILSVVAKGDDVADPGQGSSWTGYLHRWSGLSS